MDDGVAKLVESVVLFLPVSLVEVDAYKRVTALGNSALSLMGVGSPIAHKAEEAVPPVQSAMEMQEDKEVLPVTAVVEEAGHAVQLDACMAVE